LNAARKEVSRVVERAELERAAARLRVIAAELRGLAPMISLRASALAREAESRIEDLERRGQR
jgi:hypothetical protein